MVIVFLQFGGALAFFVGTLFLGILIRRNPSKPFAERLSRISHALFWGGLVLPECFGVIYPGLTAFDDLLGLPPLPFHGVLQVVAGWIILAAGIYYLAVSNIALKASGSGYAAFRLTQRVVAKSIYQRVRNPMSLGTYLSYLGISLSAGSSYLVLGTLLVIVPVHVYNLLYFEEYELSVRYGASYEEYKHRVPFIIPFKSGPASIDS